jgi:hypothetical protein
LQPGQRHLNEDPLDFSYQLVVTGGISQLDFGWAEPASLLLLLIVINKPNDAGITRASAVLTRHASLEQRKWPDLRPVHGEHLTGKLAGRDCQRSGSSVCSHLQAEIEKAEQDSVLVRGGEEPLVE